MGGKMYQLKNFGRLGLGLCLFALAACGGGGTVSTGTTNGSAALLIKDATYDNLGEFKVTFSKGVLKGTGGTSDYTLFTTDQTLDLLQLSINSSFLASGDVPEGTYSGLELTVSGISAKDSSNNDLTYDDAAQLPMTVPLEFASSVTVQNGSPVDVLLDFDVKRSYTETGSTTFTMNPVMKPDPDPAATPVEQIEVTVQSIDSSAGTFVAKTTSTPYRSFTVKLSSTTPYVVDYTYIYIGTSQITSVLSEGTKLSIQGGEYDQGKLTPDFLLKGADNYPTNFVIAGGIVTGIDTTTNEISLKLNFADQDQTGGVVTTKANNGETIVIAYSDSQTQLVLTKYGNTKTNTGDQVVTGMPIGFGGIWNNSTQKLTPLLGVLDHISTIQGTLQGPPTNVSGTIWKFTVLNGSKNETNFTSLDVYLDTDYGKLFRAGKLMTSSDFSTIKANDSFKVQTGWSLDNNREEITKGLVGAKNVYVAFSNLNTSSIDASGNPITFTMTISETSNLTELGKTSSFTMNVQIPTNAEAFEFNETTRKGSNMSISGLATKLASLNSSAYIYLSGYFDSSTDTFHATEISINTQ
ncbi:MAG TPA: DUF4382 domain-containing protein [Planctomycetes bacterium]|nr:DUF4382 domain-containing protein [Planctomycetota bacterium]